MRALLQRLSRRLPAEHGMSLIEVVVAMMIFTVTSLAVLGVLVQTMAVTRDNRARSVAANLAAQEIDRARDVEDIFAVLDVTKTVELDGDTFTIKRRTGWDTASAPGVSCGTSTGGLRYKRVNIEVSWPNMRPGSIPARADTLIEPGSRINDPLLGTILVGVTDASGAGVSGVTIQGTPLAANPNGARAFTTAPSMTDAQGCSYVLNVYPGNYEITARRSGFTDARMATTSKTTVGVSAGSSAPAAFTFDRPNTYRIQLAAGAPEDVLIPRGMPVHYVNTRGPVEKTVSSTSTARGRSAELFPWPDGYMVIPGKYDPRTDDADTQHCQSTDPAQWQEGTVGSVTYGPGSGAIATPADTVSVEMGLVSVVATDGTIRATTTRVPPGSADPGCATETTYTFSTSPGARTIALPWGTWALSGATVSSVSPPSTASGQTVTVDPRKPVSR